MIEKLKELQIILLGLVLAVGAIFCSIIVTDNMSKDNISVTGSAYEIVKSDSVDWSFEISVKNKSREEAYKELKSKTLLVNNYLFEKGLKESQINIQPVNTYEMFKNLPNGSTSNEVEMYAFNQTYKISSDDVNKIKQLSTDIAELAEKGVNITINDPEYQYSQIADLKIRLLSAATKDAKERATSMLKPTRNKVGKMRSAKMGVFQITAPNSTSVSDSGINDASTIDKKVTAVANVVFAIK